MPRKRFDCGFFVLLCLVLAIAEPSSGQDHARHEPAGLVADFFLKQHEVIRAGAIDPARKILVTAGKGPSIRVWYSFENDAKRTFATFATQGMVTSVLFAKRKNGSAWLVCGDNFGNVRIWDLDSRKQIGCFGGNQQEILAMAFSERDNVLVSSEANGQFGLVRFWDLATQKEIQSLALGSIDSLDFSSNGDFLTLANQQGELIMLKYPSLTPVWKKNLNDHGIRSTAFGQGGKSLVTAGARPLDSTIRFWEVASGFGTGKITAHRIEDAEKTEYKKKGLQSGVRIVTYSPSGLLLLSGGYDHTVCCWEAATKQRLFTLGPSRQWGDRNCRRWYHC